MICQILKLLFSQKDKGHMAVVSICYHLHCKDQTLSVSKGVKKNKGFFRSSIVNRVALDCDGLAIRNSCRWMDVLKELKHVRNSTPLYTTSLPYNYYMQEVSCNSSFSSDGSLVKKQKLELGSTKKQLRSLDSYFRKLRYNVNQLKLFNNKTESELPDRPWKSSTEKDLAILNDFLGKLNEGQAALLGPSKAEKGLESLDGYLGRVSEGVYYL